MRETYQPPAASPAGPPHDRTHSRHSHTPRRHSRTLQRHSREGGNPPPCVQTPKETAPLLPSTEFDTMQQSPTNHNENSCPRVTHAHRFSSRSCVNVSLVPARDARTHARATAPTSFPHSLPRHSREGGNPSPRHGLPPPRSGFLEVPPPSRYANQSKRTQGNSHWIHCRAVWYNVLLYTSRPIVRGHHMIQTPEDRRR